MTDQVSNPSQPGLTGAQGATIQQQSIIRYMSTSTNNPENLEKANNKKNYKNIWQHPPRYVLGGHNLWTVISLPTHLCIKSLNQILNMQKPVITKA
jgi:hypothetical protein